VAVAAGTLIAAGVVSSKFQRPTTPPPITQCGTTLAYTGGGEGFLVVTLRPVASRSVVPSAPRRSLIPRPPHAPSPHGPSYLAVVLTSYRCADAPVVIVQPASEAWTMAVARGTNGGIAGLTLRTFGRTIVIRAYANHRLAGQVALLHGYLASPPPESPASRSSSP
jgi:hypothetical protein